MTKCQIFLGDKVTLRGVKVVDISLHGEVRHGS